MEDLPLYILLLVVAWSIFNRYAVPKLKNWPPSPFSAFTMVIGYLWFFKQPIHRTLSKIANRHGPILLLRFGSRRVLVISSSSAAEELFKNDLVFANRPKLLQGEIFGCNYTNLAWAPHGSTWENLRRISRNDILGYRFGDQQDSLAEEVKLLLCRLFHNEKKTVELKPLFMGLVFNVMMRIFAGKRYCKESLTAKMESNSLLDCATRSFRMTTDEPDAGYFVPIIKFLGLMRGLENRCKELQKKGDLLMDSLIDELRAGMTCFSQGVRDKEEKVIECMLAKQQDDPKNYSDEIIRGLVLVLMSAGTDTSAGTLEWAFSLLVNHPEVLQKAHDEIENHVGNGRLLDHSDIEYLPYLQCIVKETMRMYPVAPLLVPHESSEECTVGGYTVPKGTMLMVNAWAIQNDPEIWSEPTEFKPERFEKIIGEKNGFNLMPFGYGLRSCPGQYLAVRTITLALGSLIHCFEWKRVGEEMVDMAANTGLSLLKVEPLTVVCQPRSHMVNLLSQI